MIEEFKKTINAIHETLQGVETALNITNEGIKMLEKILLNIDENISRLKK